jgi:hypothetical protein
MPVLLNPPAALFVAQPFLAVRLRLFALPVPVKKTNRTQARMPVLLNPPRRAPVAQPFLAVRLRLFALSAPVKKTNPTHATVPVLPTAVLRSFIAPAGTRPDPVGKLAYCLALFPRCHPEPGRPRGERW